MKYSQASLGRVFVVRLEDGDIVHECLERLARELAAVEKIDQDKATTKLETVLTKEREKKAA